MIVRKRLLPQTMSDVLSMTFVVIIIPVIYWFQTFVVLPHEFEKGSVMYLVHLFLCHFFMINIVGNFTFTVLCDTSTRQLVVSLSDASVEKNWRYCSSCEALAPPRSWHCETCDICILKRDHHCIFTACCIGHRNHRYFLMFIIYLFIATIYSFYYNSHFIWSKISFEFPMCILKIIFPMAIFVFGFDGSDEQLYLMLYIVTGVGMLFTGALCFYHAQLVMSGMSAGEKEKGIRDYDLGPKENLIRVFGERWYLIWILPYIESNLPGDGISWKSSPTLENSRKRK